MPNPQSDILLLTFYFLLGTIIGSFLNVWSRRLLRGEPITGRSHCESCGHPLSAIDLIPVVSFFLLRGRCRYCQKPLSWQYPLVELGTGLLFSALALVTNYELFREAKVAIPDRVLITIPLLVAASSLIVIFITDFLAQEIFDEVLFVGVASALLYRIFYRTLAGEPAALLFDLLGALAVLFFFLLLRWWTGGRGLGEGDPPVGFFVALLVGFPLVLVEIFLSFIFGALVGVILVALEKKKLKDRIAFGPFLVTAAFVTILAGDYIWSWYLQQLGF